MTLSPEQAQRAHELLMNNCTYEEFAAVVPKATPKMFEMMKLGIEMELEINNKYPETIGLKTNEIKNLPLRTQAGIASISLKYQKRMMRLK